MSADRRTLDLRYRVSPDVLVRELDGEAVVLDLASGRYFSLNATGRRILELLDGNRTLGALAADLAEEFEGPLETLAADAELLLAELESQGLVSIAG